MSNRLVSETSPYLRQHADNPVDWFPWGEEAFEKARREDKPIFLSVGYSACHWCHVMEHESFEDEATAALMNEHFVSVKVDREERPDVDAIYMKAIQAMTERGGWPMSVFLTPDREPFYGGTYFPDTPRHGMMSFIQVLERIAELWETQRDEIVDAGVRLTAVLVQGGATAHTPGGSFGPEVLDIAVAGLSRAFDRTNGGWGDAPKFPQPAVLEFVLRRYLSTGDVWLLEMVTSTLDAMARGGIYDQLGGGFHRYATDAVWLVPHFEKMLYDNAQLARVYLHAWQVTGDKLYRRITEETLDYVAREMRDPAGGFYSAQDADSEGEEGRYFVWTPEEITAALDGHSADPQEDARLFMAAYGVTGRGNFEGANILSGNA
ncbi:MAG: thioredoxin domain-containing protein, partial [Coriobacteriia bacterium]|nr:thioredoxin domain-containing protein [Coriobacteriia bacterium]